MILTATIRDALKTSLEMGGLVERVMTLDVADLAEGIEILRDSPDTLAIIVPSRDSLAHTMADDDENLPARCEVRNEFEILVTKRELRHAESGTLDCVAIKDAILARLIWTNLGVDGLLALPLEAEPMLIEQENRRGREAWKITVEIRQQLHS